jgi:cyanate lyase
VSVLLIKDFEEIVLVQMHRQGKNWKDLATVIGKSDTYTKQVVKGIQNGDRAKEYRQQISEHLGIVFIEEE